MAKHSGWERVIRIACSLVAAILGHQAQALAQVPGAKFDEHSDHRFPASSFVIDVTKTPYNAKGDGKSDDTDALQQAIADAMGRHKVVYMPNGTYLISRTLQWTNRKSDGSNAYGFAWIQGQNPLKTIIRLKEGCCPDPANSQAMMWCGGFGSADWFHNYIQDLTFDVGRDNSGAIGLQFYSNNTGAVRNVLINSHDGKGLIGLDLGQDDMNGPLLVSNVSVRGFEIGIRTGAVVNSQTFEHIAISGQSKYGIVNAGQSISIRGLKSDNKIPALRSESLTALIDSQLIGGEMDLSCAAVVAVSDAFYARNVATSGYKLSVVDGNGRPRTDQAKISELIAGTPTMPHGGPRHSLKLPIEETPQTVWDDPKNWAIVDDFGADPTGGKDSSAAIQKAIDSGATTIFFPGFYALESTVIIRGKVRRVLGTGGWIDYQGKAKPDFRVADGSEDVVSIEHISDLIGGMEIATDRTVVLRSIGPRSLSIKGHGKVFLEDISTNDVHIGKGQKLWARQLNIENEGTHFTNDGGELWVLGYKTERGGTLLETTSGGRSEIFGNFSYTTTAGKLAPMFVTRDSQVFAFFNEICFTGDPFATLISDTRRGKRSEVRAGQGSVTPYISMESK